ncbi:glycine zipper 2TM domain-containing protein [Luteimonas sp. A534]
MVRVDPVFDGARGYPASQLRCYTREDHYTGGYGSDDYRDYGSYGDDGYARDAYGRDTYRQDGYDGHDGDRYRRDDENRRMVATVVGGVVGAVLGSKVGGGSGRYATSAIGTMVGGIAGREIYDASQRDRVDRHGRVTVCDPVPDRHASGRYPDDGYGGVTEYDVTYEYGGRRYTTRTDYHPGDTIRVRVDVRPE